MPDSPLLLFVVNNPAFLISHRLPIAKAALASGYQVHVACPSAMECAQLSDAGFVVHNVPFRRGGMNPVGEIMSLLSLCKLYRQLRPDVIHHITPKPNIYGGIAARITGMKAVVFAIAGLGHMYSSGGRTYALLRKGVSFLYRLALSHNNSRVIVQNKDDASLICQATGIKPSQIELIPGSGVDLSEFVATPEYCPPLTIAMASRLLRQKGVLEFADAARILNDKGVEARFILAGEPDPGNPASIDDSVLSRLKKEGHVELPGYVSNVAEFYARANIVVLPSYYREGLPKSLIEAAACGRAIVTTDMPGCRDAILPGESGLLVPARDSISLAKAIERLINDSEMRRQMGFKGRLFAEDRFSISDVIAQHMRIYEELVR